jgi:hypothetical protein
LQFESLVHHLLTQIKSVLSELEIELGLAGSCAAGAVLIDLSALAAVLAASIRAGLRKNGAADGHRQGTCRYSCKQFSHVAVLLSEYLEVVEYLKNREYVRKI